MSDIAQKRARLEELRTERDAEYAKEQPDVNTINRINHEMNTIEEQISTAATSEEINQKHETRVQQASDDFANFLSTLDIGGGLTLRQLVSDEGDYQLLTIKLQRGFAQQATQFSDQIKGYEEREAQLQRQYDNLQQKYAESEAGNSDMSRQLNEFKLQVSDAEAKRDAAARELDEEKAKNKQLNEWNDRLQREKVLGVQGDMKVIDAEEEARLELEAKAKRLVYDVEPVEKDAISPKNFNATLAATGERFTYNWIQKNYYITVSREEGDQFRQTYETAVGKPDSNDTPVHGQVPAIETTDIPAVQPVGEQFQTANPIETAQTPKTTAGLVRETEAQGHTDVVSRDEFDQLKKAVDVAYIRLRSIEDHVMGEGAA